MASLLSDKLIDHFRKGMALKDRKLLGKTYSQTFKGSQAVDWLMMNSGCRSRKEAVELGNAIMASKIFHHITGEHKFRDKDYLYRFYILSDISSRAQWANDENIYYCSKCDTEFGLFTRRHHCRKCGGIFCDNCTRFRMVLDSYDKEPVRVCQACYISNDTDKKDEYEYEKYNPNIRASINVFPVAGKEIPLILSLLEDRFSWSGEFQNSPLSGETTEFINVVNNVPSCKFRVPIEFERHEDDAEDEHHWNLCYEKETLIFQFEEKAKADAADENDSERTMQTQVKKHFQSHCNNYGDENVCYFLQSEMPCLLADIPPEMEVHPRVWLFEIFHPTATFTMKFDATPELLKESWLQRAAVNIVRSFALWNPDEKYEPPAKESLSGKTRLHRDNFNGYALEIPSEFLVVSKGERTAWTLPLLKATLSVSVADIPFDIPPEAFFSGVASYYKGHRSYQNFALRPLQHDGNWCQGFTVEESEKIKGTNDPKTDEDKHALIFMVFGNGSMHSVNLVVPFGNKEEANLIFSGVVSSFVIITKE
eukprot:TRINITY_DN7136_c0_g1_i2.p1 TRINITY_DN7136_c0_g1~~TRINITY_DN7136_c0_g1_i2.p1  ORF type:complete len:537 (+),score=125.57 TRINITY_DN7136_c0_g1_i2:56-1666(+)